MPAVVNIRPTSLADLTHTTQPTKSAMSCMIALRLAATQRILEPVVKLIRPALSPKHSKRQCESVPGNALVSAGLATSGPHPGRSQIRKMLHR